MSRASGPLSRPLSFWLVAERCRAIERDNQRLVRHMTEIMQRPHGTAPAFRAPPQDSPYNQVTPCEAVKLSDSGGTGWLLSSSVSVPSPLHLPPLVVMCGGEGCAAHRGPTRGGQGMEVPAHSAPPPGRSLNQCRRRQELARITQENQVGAVSIRHHRKLTPFSF